MGASCGFEAKKEEEVEIQEHDETTPHMSFTV
jgi:hypothetical protein